MGKHRVPICSKCAHSFARSDAEYYCMLKVPQGASLEQASQAAAEATIGRIQCVDFEPRAKLSELFGILKDEEVDK